MLDFFEPADTLPPPLPVDARDIPGLRRDSPLLCGILLRPPNPSPLSDPLSDDSLLPLPPPPPPVLICSFEPLFFQMAESFLPPLFFSAGSFVAGEFGFDFRFENRDFPELLTPPPPPPVPLILFLRPPVLEAVEGAEAGLDLAAVVERGEFLAAPLLVDGVSLVDKGVPPSLAEDFAGDAREWILDLEDTLAVVSLLEVFAGADDTVRGFTAKCVGVDFL